MLKPDWHIIYLTIRKYILNKYILTLVIFSLIMLFVGDQSILNRLKRAHIIHKLQQQETWYRDEIKKAQYEINILQNPDSLEKYAREHYYMHTPDEDVYIINEDDLTP